MTRTTKTTTRKPTYVTNTNTRGTKTGVSNNSRGTKTVKVTNAAGTTYTKVTNAAGKTFTKATDSKGNVIKPKVTAKVVAKVTPKVTATKPLANNKVKTATVTPTPRATSTRGKSYLVENDRGIIQYGTAAQADSATLSRSLNNKGGLNANPFNPTDRVISGIRTKQAYDRDMATYAKNPKMLNSLTTGPRRKKREDLPDYVAPKNTGGGKLLSKTEVYGSTGRGGCLPGFKLDRNGNCVRTSPY